MADLTVGLQNPFPGVPANGTQAAGGAAAADLTFTALLSTQIAQLGTAAGPTDDESTAPEAADDESDGTTVPNPFTLLLGGVLHPTPLTNAAVPASAGGADSRVETLRFAGPVNRPAAAPVDTPQEQPAPVPKTGQPASLPTEPTPLNAVTTAALSSQSPPATRVVVPQTPIVSDRTQMLPNPPVELRPVPALPPVSETEPIAGVSPVTADQQSAGTRQRTIDKQQAAPTPTEVTFPDSMRQAAAVASRKAPDAIAQFSADVALPTPGGGGIDTVRSTPATVEPEWVTRSAADGTQVLDAVRVQPGAVPVPTGTPEHPTAVTRVVTTPAAQVSDTWITHADVRSKDGGHEFRLRLDPPELGEVRVRVHSSADGVRAELTVASDAVRAMIESQIPELRQRLQDGGVSVSQFDVTTNTPGGDSSAHTPDREPQPREARPDPAAGPAAPRGRSRDPTAAVGGLLDVTA